MSLLLQRDICTICFGTTYFFVTKGICYSCHGKPTNVKQDFIDVFKIFIRGNFKSSNQINWHICLSNYIESLRIAERSLSEGIRLD